MINLLKLLIKIQQKNSKLTQSKSGFTLVELLVAIAISSIILASLMGFAFNMISSDRNEQVKATSEQEIQSALDYIAQDLSQAVFIYDNDGLSKIKAEIPSSCGGSTSTCVPVLVFWKRETIPKIIPVIKKPDQKDDTFVYSLVAYYLVKSENGNDGNWSNTARIGRFQITDGVINPNDPTNSDGTPKYIENPSKGFQPFDLTVAGSTLKDKMELWQKGIEPYTNDVVPLIDFVDQSANDYNFQINCLAGTQKVPEFIVDGGFAACVDSNRNVAQVFIRGNALARTQNNEDTPSTFNNNNSSYFPTGNIQIKGIGSLGVN